MKKRIYIFIISSFMVFGISACSELLELSPRDSISQNSAFGSDQTVKNALIGAYDILSNGNLFGGNLQRDAELLGGLGEVRWLGTFDAPGEVYNNAMDADTEEYLERWKKAYEGIILTNNIIEALGVVLAPDRDRVAGEAQFIRALLYLELLRTFSPQYQDGRANDQLGVPLVLLPSQTNPKGLYPIRNSVEAVYDQVIEDARAARDKLPEVNGVFATKGAANALLARVFLQKGDFFNALTAANAVIESGYYVLLPTYSEVFNRDENSDEDIFSVQISSNDGANTLNTFFSTEEFGGRQGDIEILSGHLNLYQPGDSRLELFYEGNDAIRSGKWNNSTGNISLFRLAEMYLIRAECNFRLSSTLGADPQSDLLEIQVRAGAELNLSPNLEDILIERRKELAHEGFRIHDLRRLDRVAGLIEANDPKLVFPIPARELILNSALVQNPGY